MRMTNAPSDSRTAVETAKRRTRRGGRGTPAAFFGLTLAAKLIEDLVDRQVRLMAGLGVSLSWLGLVAVPVRVPVAGVSGGRGRRVVLVALVALVGTVLVAV